MLVNQLHSRSPLIDEESLQEASLPRHHSRFPAPLPESTSAIPATVLVVDDNPSVHDLLGKLLKSERYRLISASSGAEALQAARNLPDVILLDLMMPGMDGYEVCRRLRAEPAFAQVPIILLTALDDRDSRLRGLEAGADDFVTKPFNFAELRARLRTITRLNRYRSLYEERARYEAALAYAPEAIVLAERDGTIISRNAAFNALLSPRVLGLDNIYSHLQPERAQELRAEIAGGSRPTTLPREFTLRFGRTAETIVELTWGLIPWQGRGIIQYHLRDLTERKVLESQLIQSQRIELLGQLAGSVVHDLNNILTAIDASVSLLGILPDAEHGAQHQNIHASVQRGSSVLQQLLLFARGADHELKLASPVLPVAEVVDLVRNTFGRNYTVTLQAESGLPPIQHDPTQLHQVVMNLCVNARDAMPQGGRLNISMRRSSLDAAALASAGPGATPGEYIAIAVRDHGTGIPAEIRPKLFDPFFTTKPAGKGTGLGLATVMRLVRRHGGFVTLETEVGQGTCFTCHFPVKGPELATA